MTWIHLLALFAASLTAGISLLRCCEASRISYNCRTLGNNVFKCKSGDCINRTLICNNKKDCVDGYDESDEICKKRIVRATEEGCVLPQQPPNGRYLLGGCNPPACLATPGSRVNSALLNYTCAPGYSLSGPPLVFCDGQLWSSSFPSCLTRRTARQCLPLISSSHIIQCTYNDREVKCDQPMQPSTKASVKCKKFYETSSDTENQDITCDRNGYWSQPVLPCSPKCGEFNFTTTSVVTERTKSTSLPWFAAVKTIVGNEMKYVCAATIISSRVVASAAHCVWDEIERKVFSADNYQIVVGEYEHGPKEIPSHYTQQFMVEEIRIPDRFKGNNRFYEEDICLFILKTDIIMNEMIRPVCVDLEDTLSPYFVPGKIGIIGSMREPFGSTYRLIISMPIVDFEECYKTVPADFQIFLTYDKFCAGVLKTETVCVGDSGGGFSSQFRNKKWYLTGILSVGVVPKENGACEINFYKAYTRVSLFRNLIKKALTDVSNNISVPASPSLSLSCMENEFECTHTPSLCIDKSYLCDGIKDCHDGSDETYEKCHLLTCPETFFQCRYGACVDKIFVCNGKKDCEDGSDEESCQKPTTNTTCLHPPSSGCKLPAQPENGFYTFLGCKSNNLLIPDTIVPVGVFLNFSCNSGFVLSGPPLIACYDNWSSQPPHCNPVLCSPLKNPSREIQCVLNTEDVDCVTESVKPRTRASIKCKVNYETIPGLQAYDMICQSDGTWNRELHSCIPKCGIPNSRGVQFISHGHRSELAEFPWHIGFYETLENGTVIPSCGGSIVSSRIVVSAAHCFWKNNEIDFSEYYVVAGKYYYAWENKTKYVQHLQIEEIILPKNYRGSDKNYANDIAIVILKYEIKINEAVRPVCVDYDRTFLRYFSPVGTIGNVTGWGLNENQHFNEVLHVANLAYVDIDECERNTPDNFHAILTNDKFCAGNINRTTVCRGDSGGSYTVRFKDGRLYLVGIVSIGASETCGVFPYATFTNVFNHLDFIREHVYKFV